MQNVPQEATTDNSRIDKVNVGTSSTPQSTANSSPAKSETETYSEHRRYMSGSSESEEDSVSEEFEEDPQVETTKFLLNPEEDRAVDPETQARLEALLQAAGIGKLTARDGKNLGDPEVLRRLTSSVSCALDEAAAALTRMRSDNQPRPQTAKLSLVEACTDGDVGTVKKLLTEGRSVHETSEEGESLLSLACSAGYFELAQVLLAMHANVEDRGIKGECTPLMEAASAGHIEIVRLLIAHGADVNAQSTSGNTPLMYGCAGGHTDVVKLLLENGANVEDHNENGHTPLMEAASAGHVDLAKILLVHGAGINTHSNEFKESALTLACYKGHLDMVRFLLEAGADQEHKTDEMHTALMEASMDGHVEVARLLLDSGAQVNMPTDSFESPLTLAACGGHVDLALLLIERGANIEEVNDEGYTPLMEAAREGHEEMVHLLLGQGANINAQTDETQETALTLACCGGFTEVAEILLKSGADIELGASTPLMEAAQEGHLELVKYLLKNHANVHAQTQTGDTALTYACENGHTDVADLLLQYEADLEHESEGGRTPLMKACRAGHMCTVQFLIMRGANVRRQTTNNDHTPLSLACAGGHLPVVELLLSHNADPNHKLKDNSTMLIEAAKGGHTTVVQLLLDYPHSMQPMMLNQQGATTATNLSMLPGQVGSRESPLPPGALPTTLPPQPINFFQAPLGAVLQEVPEAVRIVQQEENGSPPLEVNSKQQVSAQAVRNTVEQNKISNRKSILPKSRPTGAAFDGNLTSAEAQQVRSQPLNDFDEEVFSATAAMEFLNKEDPNSTLIDFINNRKKQSSYNIVTSSASGTDEGTTQKQQILEELHKVERDLNGKQHVFQYANPPQEQCPATANTILPQNILNIDISMQHKQQGTNTVCLQSPGLKLAVSGDSSVYTPPQPAFYFTPLPTSAAVSLSTATPTSATQPIKFQSVTSHAEVSQNTAISDRPKAKPVSKKEGKNVRKQQQPHFQANPCGQIPPQIFGQLQLLQQPQLAQNHQQMETSSQQQQQQPQPPTQFQQSENTCTPSQTQEILNVHTLDLDCLRQDGLGKEDTHENLLTASILQQIRNSSIGHNQDGSKVTKLELSEKDFTTVEDVVQTLESFSSSDVTDQNLSQHNLQVQPYPSALDESMIASLTATQQDLSVQTDLSRVEYFAVPTNGTQVAAHALYPYDHYITASGLPNKDLFQAGFQAGYNLSMQQLACPNASANDTLTTTTVVPTTVGALPGTSTQQYITPPQQQSVCTPVQTTCPHVSTTAPIQATHVCQIPCSQQQSIAAGHHHQPLQLQPQVTHQVQAATQTPQTVAVPNDSKKIPKATVDGIKFKKGRILRHPNQPQPGNNFQQNQNYQIDHNSAITQYSGSSPQQCPNPVIPPCMDVDSETESNRDTALTLACAGGHDELVELLISRGADIEHRDKKGFTPLILAATAGHEKVVDILLNRNAEIEAQSERTKDTPLSLACSGGRYEVVELLLNRSANKEHRNVSDYTPLSLAASGGYVNIIKLLLSHGAEINSRTGSKLGISPLMLAAMNGHTAAVKLLLDMGSDINAQIETNRNTALTLACFQGRHEVVSLLLDRKANVEHRAKTGLTPLMEAASGGYVEVGRVLLDKGADVNATPVPSSRDTALTIAADKGHVRFVELLLCRGAQVEVKNKKGNSPLWLAANGGHLPVVELLYNVNADIDSQDNRKVSCLMAAFRKGHLKVVKWMVHHVTQFPSDQEMIRYIATVSDKELLEKCHECVKIIRAAKETQAAKANKNASILLEELDMEKTREESKKMAAARRRERKKKKKLEKKEERRKLLEENKKNENYDEKDKKDNLEEDKTEDEENVPEANPAIRNGDSNDKEEGDSGIDANSQGSCSSSDLKSTEKRKDKKKKKSSNSSSSKSNNENHFRAKPGSSKSIDMQESPDKTDKFSNDNKNKGNLSIRKGLVFEATKSPAERDDFEATGNEVYVSSSTKSKKSNNFELETSPPKGSSTSPKQTSKREEGWKEVVRKSSVQTVSTSESGVKKVSVPLNAISRVIGRGGSNINAIRGATGAHIEVEKQSKGQGDRCITIKGSADATKQAHSLIATLIKDPDVDILQMLPKTNKAATTTTTLWDKTQIGTKKNVGKVLVVTQPSATTISNAYQKPVQTVAPSLTTTSRSTTTSTVKLRNILPIVTPRVTAPRLVAQAEKNAAAAQSSVRLPVSHAITSRPSILSASTVPSVNQTFAAKLIDIATSQVSSTHGGNTTKSRTSLSLPLSAAGPVSPQAPPAALPVNIHSSPNKNTRPTPTASAPPTMQHFQSPGKAALFVSNQNTSTISGAEAVGTIARSTTPNMTQPNMQVMSQEDSINQNITQAHSEYSLFYADQLWTRQHESHKPINFAAVTGAGCNSQTLVQPKFIDHEPPPPVDASKAPGYRGVVCSPVSSKASSNSTTPPNSSSNAAYPNYQDPTKNQPLPPIGSNIHNRSQHTDFYADFAKVAGTAMNLLQMTAIEQPHVYPASTPIQNIPDIPPISASRLNPKAPDFSSSSAYHPMSKIGYNYNPGNNPQNMFSMQKCAVDNYPRPMQNSLPGRWMLQPIQNELMTNMAGMTLHSIARAAGGEILENGGDLGLVNNSPNMSPSLQAHLHHESGYHPEERKAPQPIGTERARKVFNSSGLEQKWYEPKEEAMPMWQYDQVQVPTMNRNQMYADELTQMDFSRPMPLDSAANYTNGPPYFNHQQQQIGGIRPDFIPVDGLKVDIPWDPTRPNISDIQEKPHGWNKWNNK